jgi:hypothetical protein
VFEERMPEMFAKAIVLAREIAEWSAEPDQALDVVFDRAREPQGRALTCLDRLLRAV